MVTNVISFMLLMSALMQSTALHGPKPRLLLRNDRQLRLKRDLSVLRLADDDDVFEQWPVEPESARIPAQQGERLMLILGPSAWQIDRFPITTMAWNAHFLQVLAFILTP